MRAWFLNLGPTSTTTEAEANADIKAMLATDPALVLGCEGVAKGDLPPAGKGRIKIRDTSNEGRANLWAYIKGADKDQFKWDWTDCTKSFPRALHPEMGMHPPRSILRFPFFGEQIVVAHKPPAWKGSGPARWEHDQKLVRIMKPGKGYDPRRSRMLFWDCNGLPGARKLADRVDGWVVGNEIDCAVVRKIKVVEHGYRKGVGGHRFATDHEHGAFFLRWEWV
jgi:hypothetical protein